MERDATILDKGHRRGPLTENAGVNRVTVAKIETGRKQGSVTTLRALADAPGVSMGDLAG
ncbi:helix-turn-helix domain-containing protein [Roseinatronobacter sp. S2]|uniref:helix-turn-helix domain-containing protein n=1 Tax=Roseinatronobacter sp. S2 TaxID=3035471 RepID=UPI002410A9EC|nr:helix-turn-helix transcriptional regulator [Roseinatronobacter sp. S2]WFE75326.1 helix-turn-helix transcriptional regulator [Roseinatronobacter sp. S2]